MNKKIISLLMTVCMLITLLCGCGSKAASNTKVESEKITVTDVLGREITLDKAAKKIIATGAGALRLYCYVGSPDKVVGIENIDKSNGAGKTNKNKKQSLAEMPRPYMMANKSLTELPSIGQGGPDNGLNVEKILEVKPDVIFTTYAGDKAAVDKLQEKVGIPVVALDYGKISTFDPKVYSSIKIIGKVIGEDKRANEVVDYMEKCKNDLNDRTKDIPKNKKPSAYAGALAYYGAHGIESTQGNYSLFNAVNAKNVVDELGKTGSIMLDKEKLLQWNPDKIFIDYTGIGLLKEDYKKNSQFYKGLEAFKNEQVYSLLPYNWYWTNIEVAISDAYYIGKILYPDKFKDVDPEKKADEIYKFFLGKEIYKDIADYYGGFKKITAKSLQ